jgi:DNA-binding NarL/FixJ family response regulator
MTTAKPVRVLLVDDHVVARCGMRMMLGAADEVEVTAEAASASCAFQILARQEFEVALLDIGLPDRNGLEVLKAMREQYPAMAVIIISMQAEEMYAIRALKLGAAGYVSKDSCIETLVAAVRKAAAGGKHVSPALLQKLADMLGGDGSEAPLERLTDRELEVFKLIAGGQSLVAIANRLHLSPSTVTTYRTRVMEKMGLKNNAEMTRFAVEHHLLG